MKYKVARAVEHLLIDKYGRKFDKFGTPLGGQLDNFQNGIHSRKLKNYGKELIEAKKLISQLGL